MLEPKDFFTNENHLLSKGGHTFPYYQLPDLLQYPATAEVLVEYISSERSIGEEKEVVVRYGVHHQDIRSSDEYEFIGHFDIIDDQQVFVIETFEEVPFEEMVV